MTEARDILDFWFQEIEEKSWFVKDPAFDAVLLGLVAAAVAGHARWRSAIDSEREGIRCLHCGHDVRGHRAEVELATCPECGAEFRTRDRPPVAKRAVSGDNDPRARS